MVKKKEEQDNLILFVQFVAEVEKLPIEERQNFVNREFETLKNKLKFPITGKHDVIFVYKGWGNNVKLVGDMTSWQMFPIPLNRLTGTDLFYLEQHYEEDARLDYKFLIDDNELILDYLNHNICPGGFGINSELVMPEYPKHQEANYLEDISHGKIIEEVVECEAVKEGNKVIIERQLKIYTPHNYDKTKKYKVLYFQDGSDYIKFGKAVDILDYMIDKGEIEPVLAVFVDPVDRDEDYILSHKEAYINFFINKLMPWFEEKYSARGDAEGRMLIGISSGASIITCIVYKYPEKFRYALCQSGDFSYAYEEDLGEPYGKNISNVPYPIRICIIIGDYDLELISSNIWLYSDLKDNPSVKAVKLRRYPQGHSWGLWRDTLREGLIWLFSEDNK